MVKAKKTISLFLLRLLIIDFLCSLILCKLITPSMAEQNTLILPSSLISVEDYTFYGNTSIHEVILPDGIKQIKNNAFANSSIKRINLPTSISLIEKNAFYGTTETLIATVEIGSYAQMRCDELGIKWTVKPLPSEYFSYFIKTDSFGNESITITGYHGPDTTLSIPPRIDGIPVTTIGRYAFSEQYTLWGPLIIPDSITVIEDYAFSNMRNLHYNLTIPESITSIGDYAFYGCENLSGDLTIPGSVKSIGNHAFDNCPNLAGNLYMEVGVEHIGDYAFYGACFKNELILPDGIDYIGNYAFFDCEFSGSLTIPSNVSRIGISAFERCQNFSDNLYISKDVTSIGDCAFKYCGFNTKLTIMDGVKYIGNDAFYGCSFSGDTVIPNSIINIGNNAFYGSSAIIGTASDFAISALAMPTKFIYEIVDNHVEIIGFDGGNSTYWFTIPDEIAGLPVTVIRDNAFKGNVGLKGSLTIPPSITTIGAYAFSGCAGFFGDLTIPSSVTEIGDYAFYQCTGLNGSLRIQGKTSVGKHAFDGCSKIIGPLSIDNITSLGEYSFRGCSALEDWPKIPSQITEIPPYAFYNCYSIGYLMLPSTLARIDEYAFANCSNLEGSISLPDDAVIASTAFSGCGDNFEILTYTKKNELQLAAQDTLFSIMNTMIEPDDLFSIMKDDSTTWMNAVANAAIEIANLNASALLSDYNKKQYLFANVLKNLQSDTLTFKHFDIIGIPPSLKDFQSIANCTKETYLNGLLDWCDEETKAILTTQDFRNLFSEYYDGEKDNSNYVLEYLRVHGLAGKEEDILADMDFLRDISFISDIISELGKFEKGYTKTLEVMNQLQLILALDKEALLQSARIYQSSSDNVVNYVGDMLEWLAYANEVQIITSVVSGELSEFGLNQFLNEVVKKSAKKAITKGLGSYAATLTLSITVVNTITGVDEVPRLTNELSYSTDATRNAYAVFNTDRSAYDRYRDDASFTNAFWSYVTYCETAAQSQDAFIGLYEYIDNSMSGDLFITDEMRDVVAFSKAQAKGLRTFADDAKAIYKLWENGDVIAFKTYCEKMREKVYTYEFQTNIQ